MPQTFNIGPQRLGFAPPASWLYESEQIDDEHYKLRICAPGAQLGDYLDESLGVFYQITDIIEQRDHKGTFTNPDLSKGSHLIVEARMLSREEVTEIKNQNQNTI